MMQYTFLGRSFSRSQWLLMYSLFFKAAKKWVNRVGAKVYPEILSNISDDLISMHGTAFQELKDHEIEEPLHEFRLNLSQFPPVHFQFLG